MVPISHNREYPDRTDPSALYETMLLIRTFEDKIYSMFLHNLVPGTIHLYQGEEAIASGVCAHLNSKDILTSNHRCHGHALAKGMKPEKLMAEVLGKATGCSKGKGGSMHICDMEAGLAPVSAIVGAGVPIAAGAALTFVLRSQPQVAVSMFGDSATNTGAFHEGVTLAAVWNLPVVFVCENNLYGVSTSIRDSSRLVDLAQHAHAYGIPGVVVDGNDVLAVSRAAGEAIERARAGGGPTMIEAKTYRHGGHSRSDPAMYRPKEEKEAWMKKDPIPRMRTWLLKVGGVGEEEVLAIETRCRERIEQAADFAIHSPVPDAVEALTDVFGGGQ